MAVVAVVAAVAAGASVSEPGSAARLDVHAEPVHYWEFVTVVELPAESEPVADPVADTAAEPVADPVPDTAAEPVADAGTAEDPPAG